MTTKSGRVAKYNKDFLPIKSHGPLITWPSDFDCFNKICSCRSSNAYNPMQNIWNKLEKSSKIGQDKKSLISTFGCFLTATAKV